MTSFQVKEYKDGLIKKAEILITIGFPEKIVRLNELLETEMFADRNLHDVHQVSGKMKFHLHNFCDFHYFGFRFVFVQCAGVKHSRTRTNHSKPCE